MSFKFEELDYQKTPLGDISLRRRAEPRLDGKILYEVKLGDEFLMSSLFTEAEIQLASLGLAALNDNKLSVVVGGLGLGYTAAEVLNDSRVNSLTVIDVMEPVINWHKDELVPLGKQLNSDSRCNLLHADFFESAAISNCGFDPLDPSKLEDAILLDIDHSPNHWLNQANSDFYSTTSLNILASKLTQGGIFGLWSNEPPDDHFTELLSTVFESTQSHIVDFSNPYTNGTSSNTVYIAQKQ